MRLEALKRAQCPACPPSVVVYLLEFTAPRRPSALCPLTLPSALCPCPCPCPLPSALCHSRQKARGKRQRQETRDKSQKTKDKTKDKRQKTKDKRQKTKDKRQKTKQDTAVTTGITPVCHCPTRLRSLRALFPPDHAHRTTTLQSCLVVVVIVSLGCRPPSAVRRYRLSHAAVGAQTSIAKGLRFSGDLPNTQTPRLQSHPARLVAKTASSAALGPPSPPSRTSAPASDPALLPARWSLTNIFNLSFTPRPRLPASRLWNPVNSSPRAPALPNIPVQHSYLGDTLPQPGNRDEYPLLTLPEQRQSRQSPAPSSLVVERSTGADSRRTSIGLPHHRKSLPITWPHNAFALAMPTKEPAEGENLAPIPGPSSHDMEAGAKAKRLPPSRASLPNSRRASASMHSTASNDEAEDTDDNASDIPWGPSHPCFPHPNPHVPLDSSLYDVTRVIRIKRDWMQKGDLAPTFANLYPEILDPLISEEEFRVVIKKINDTLLETFDPLSFRAWLDAVMGIVTFWLWDDVGLSKVKQQLAALEQWIEDWNRDAGEKEGVKIIPLRRTGYMTLDIQVPDPQLGPDTRPNTQQDDLQSTAPQHPEFDYGPYPLTPTLNVQPGSPERPHAV